MKKPGNIDEYIIQFPVETQVLLQKLRETIRKVAPGAKEVISYGMPAFRQNGILVYFAGFKNHIGFYPTPCPYGFSKRSYRNSKLRKERYSFHWINRFRFC